APRRARTAHHGRGLQGLPQCAGGARICAAARARAALAATPPVDHPATCGDLMPRIVHVIGAGLAGLSAAVRLAERGESVAVHEAAGQAGGRCRSYHDPALDMEIDNGNHLLLSANQAALSYLRTIGAEAKLVGPPHADFPFVDLASGERWT